MEILAECFQPEFLGQESDSLAACLSGGDPGTEGKVHPGCSFGRGIEYGKDGLNSDS